MRYIGDKWMTLAKPAAVEIVRHLNRYRDSPERADGRLLERDFVQRQIGALLEDVHGKTDP